MKAKARGGHAAQVKAKLIRERAPTLIRALLAVRHGEEFGARDEGREGRRGGMSQRKDRGHREGGQREGGERWMGELRSAVNTAAYGAQAYPNGCSKRVMQGTAFMWPWGHTALDLAIIHNWPLDVVSRQRPCRCWNLLPETHTHIHAQHARTHTHTFILINQREDRVIAD